MRGLLGILRAVFYGPLWVVCATYGTLVLLTIFIVGVTKRGSGKGPRRPRPGT